MDQQLIAFVAVADEQSFTRAAEKLHISQPAISQHVQALEQRLDVKLLDRTNKYVRLNRAGEMVYAHAKEILSLYAHMARLVEDMKSDASGELIIGASFTFGEYVLPHVVADFRKQYPRIIPHIEIANTHSVIERVSQGTLDIGIIEGRTTHEAMIDITPFAEDTLVFVASGQHPFATMQDVSIDELQHECWFVRERGSGTREVTDDAFKEFGIQPETMIEYGSTQVIKESVEAGLGITLLSVWTIRKELKSRLLAAVPVPVPPIKRKFSIALRKSAFYAKAVQLFREHLMEHTIDLEKFFENRR